MSGTGYTRQTSEIASGNGVQSTPLNSEFNQLQSAFDSTSGHAHDGGAGGGAPITIVNGLTNVAGMVNFNGTDTFTPRTLVSTSAALVITNGAGTAGAPSFALNADLQGIATLNTNGILNRTSGGTYSAISATDLSAIAALNINGIPNRTSLGNYSAIVPTELLGIVALATTGLVQRTGAGAYSTVSGSIGSVSMQTFTSTGTYTPVSGMKYVWVIITGGGGGGLSTSSAQGGGSGETALGVFTATDIGASQTITIGAAGAHDGNGGTTSIGSLLTAAGGGTGGLQLQNGGTGGSGTGLHIPGGDGVSGNGGAPIWGGAGGGSFWGSGGAGAVETSFNGTAGRAYGAGGGGGQNGGTSGGAGAKGVVMILEFT